MSSPKAGFVRRKTLTGKTGLAKATQKKGELATSDKMSSEKKLKEKEKSSDPLQDLIAAVKQQDKKREQPEQAKKKRKVRIGQKTIRVVKKAQTSMMAVAMRQFFIKSLKKFLATGQMKSKYFYKFEVSHRQSTGSF